MGDGADPNPSGVFDWRGGCSLLFCPSRQLFCNTNGLQGMNDNLDIFELFREVFSVKTTDIAELMPTKAEQLEEVMR